MSGPINERLCCALGGALPAVTSLHRFVPVVHAGPGCGLQTFFSQAYGSGFHGSTYVGGVSIPSSNTYEREVVFGGEGRLREELKGTLNVMDGDAFVVLTGCTSALIGDDVSAVVQEFKGRAKIAYAEVSGFKGNTYYGYDAVWEALAGQLVEPSRKVRNRVNLFGVVPTQDIFWKGNLNEIKRLLELLGLEVATFYTRRQGLNTVLSASSAALNIVLSPYLARSAVETLEKRFGTPTLRFPYLPIGPTATAEFLTRVAGALKIPNAKLKTILAAEHAEVYDALTEAALSLTAFQLQKRVALVGDSNTVAGLIHFLADDLGHFPELAIVTDQPPEDVTKEIAKSITKLRYADAPEVLFLNDQEDSDAALRRVKPELVFGSTLDKDIARELHATHLSVSFPITDRLILDRAYAGNRGSICLLEDIMTAFVSTL